MLLGLQHLLDVCMHGRNVHHELRLSNVSRFRRHVQYPLLFPVLLGLGLLRLLELPVEKTEAGNQTEWVCSLPGDHSRRLMS